MIKRWLLSITAISIILGTFSLLRADNRNIVRFGKDIVIDRGETVENAVCIGCDITVYGEVEENVVSVGGSVYLKPDAYIRGDVVIVGGEIDKEHGVQIKGDIVEVGFPGIHFLIPPFKGFWWGLYWPFRMISLITFIGLTILIVAIFPKQVNDFTSTVEQNAPASLLWGFLGLLFILPVAILLCISIVGILLVPLEFLFVFCAFLMGYITIARIIGKKIFDSFNRSDQPIILEASIGILALWIIGLIPFLGWIVKYFIVLLGFGGILVTIIHKRKRINQLSIDK